MESGDNTGGVNQMLNTDTIQITPELLALLSEIDEFKGAWRALGTLAPERLNALRRVATIESIGSSTRIEGSKLTDREVERLLGQPGNQAVRAPATSRKLPATPRSWKPSFRAWADIPITENHIKQLHRDLLALQREGRTASRRIQDPSQQMSAPSTPTAR